MATCRNNSPCLVQRSAGFWFASNDTTLHKTNVLPLAIRKSAPPGPERSIFRYHDFDRLTTARGLFRFVLRSAAREVSSSASSTTASAIKRGSRLTLTTGSIRTYSCSHRQRRAVVADQGWRVAARSRHRLREQVRIKSHDATMLRCTSCCRCSTAGTRIWNTGHQPVQQQRPQRLIEALTRRSMTTRLHPGSMDMTERRPETLAPCHRA